MKDFHEAERWLKRFFGIRIIKTGFAVALSAFLSDILNFNMPIMVTISAIVTMSNSIFEAYTVSRNRMISTTVGFIVAIILLEIGFTGPIAIFFGVIIIINVCNYFKWNNSIVLALIVFVSISFYGIQPEAEREVSNLIFGVNRLVDTFLGLIIGVLVNRFILPPNQNRFILETYKASLKEAGDSLLKILNEDPLEIVDLNNDVRKLDSELQVLKADQKYYSKKSRVSLNELKSLNSKFYEVFALLSTMIENKGVPIIYSSTKEKLETFYKDSIDLSQHTTAEDYETAFNYYLDDLIDLLIELDNRIDELESKMKEKGQI